MAGFDENITRQDLITALQRMSEEIRKDPNKFREGSKYFVPYDGRRFPPKELIRYVHDLKGVDPGRFHGGGETDDFLSARGIPSLEKEKADKAISLLRTVLKDKSSYPEVHDLLGTWTEVVQNYSSYLNKDNVENITESEIASIKDPIGSNLWTLVQQKNDFARGVPQLKKILNVIFSDNPDLSGKIDAIDEMSGEFVVPMAEAKITALFALNDPNSCGIMDSSAKKALDELGIFPRLRGRPTKGNIYWAFNEVLKGLTRNLSVNMWELDALFRGVDTTAGHDPVDINEEGVNDVEINEANPIEIYSLIKKKKQVILFGPPGTGKTHETRQMALGTLGEGVGNMDQYEEMRKAGRIGFITFHPSYSYEEFIEGITIDAKSTVAQKDGKPTYILRDGVFKSMAKKALAASLAIEMQGRSFSDLLALYDQTVSADSGSSKRDEFWTKAPRFVLIVDEINRGDISKIFGELITLLENNKRLGMANELRVTLPYSQEEFAVPPNLFIIGTMNTADKSIALLDVALRRRFGFIEMSPDFDVFNKNHIERYKSELERTGVITPLETSVTALKKINRAIADEPTLGRDKCIGHAFLFGVMSTDDLIMVWNNEIVPLLEEYCYGSYSMINRLMFAIDNTKWFDQVKGFKTIKNEIELKDFLKEVVG